MPSFTQILNSIGQLPDYAGLTHITRGVEKESLRITPEGTLAMTPHPQALGSALTHPHITTDYSEALLEFITEPGPCVDKIVQQLHELHHFTYQNIGDEHLWITSMPCMLGKDADIPIARYGSSNSGTMKSVYRLGLGHRYGRSMQTIAGIHYNFSISDQLWEFLQSQEQSSLSLQDFKTQGYFRLIRNFRRYFWLLLYLFGASPAVCKSFVRDRRHNLVPFDDDPHTLHSPYGTSLRMGDLGYQSNAQESLVITYNCLNSYIDTLCQAITQPHADYARTSVKDPSGDHQQLNDSLLQIENEFYSVIRPKRTSRSGETALSALTNGGIEYIEVRCLDLNPYEPAGITQQQMQFMDTFLLYCLLSDSPTSDESEHHQIQENQRRMVYSGRDPELHLYDQGKERPMREWAQSLMANLDELAQLLDQAGSPYSYQQSVATEQEKLNDDSLTPSARILADMRAQKVTFFRLAMNLSMQHKAYFADKSLQKYEQYRETAAQSLKDQQHIEAQDTISFEEYLRRYYSQYQCASPDLAIAE